LQNILQERRVRLFGILNGIDNEATNPEANPYLERNYSIRSLNLRAHNKLALQKKFNLKEDPAVPIFAFVSRFSDQKGISLFIETLEPLLTHTDFQLIVLGTGDSKYMTFFSELEKKYPQVATHLSFDPILPHMIYAGADVVLIPSRFEPSGLTQMEAMRYGAIPLVRSTGGLADSVTDYSPGKQTGTGFVFNAFDQYAFFAAFIRALETYKYKEAWTRMQKRAMSRNFSWDESAKAYLRLFRKAIAFNQERKK
jgi:starch synthase